MADSLVFLAIFTLVSAGASAGRAQRARGSPGSSGASQPIVQPSADSGEILRLQQQAIDRDAEIARLRRSLSDSEAKLAQAQQSSGEAKSACGKIDLRQIKGLMIGGVAGGGVSTLAGGLNFVGQVKNRFDEKKAEEEGGDAEGLGFDAEYLAYYINRYFYDDSDYDYYDIRFFSYYIANNCEEITIDECLASVRDIRMDVNEEANKIRGIVGNEMDCGKVYKSLREALDSYDETLTYGILVTASIRVKYSASCVYNSSNSELTGTLPEGFFQNFKEDDIVESKVQFDTLKQGVVERLSELAKKDGIIKAGGRPEPKGLGKLATGTGGIITAGLATAGGLASAITGGIGIAQFSQLEKEIEECQKAAKAL